MNPPQENTISWFAIYVKPRSEKKTFQSLQLKHIDSYLPLQTTLKQWSDRKKKVDEPLFKSYLFVHINYEKQHADVLQTQGALAFVRTGKEPAKIRDSVIEAIQISLMHYNDIESSSENFSPNQKVTVIGGPLKGFEGIIVEQHGNRYFAIQIPELGTHMLVKVPAAYLKSE